MTYQIQIVVYEPDNSSHTYLDSRSEDTIEKAWHILWDVEAELKNSGKVPNEFRDTEKEGTVFYDAWIVEG